VQEPLTCAAPGRATLAVRSITPKFMLLMLKVQFCAHAGAAQPSQRQAAKAKSAAAARPAVKFTHIRPNEVPSVTMH
jgi:hypothetical protein